MPWRGVGTAVVGGLLGMGDIGISSAINAGNSKKQYKYNLRLQQQAQGWQEYMSNTAHQRQVADLRAAGLNPVLSANGGASSGSVGATSVGLQSTNSDIAGSAIGAYNSAISKKSQEALEKYQNRQMDIAEKRSIYENKLLKAQGDLAAWQSKFQPLIDEYALKNAVVAHKQNLFNFESSSLQSIYNLEKTKEEIENLRFSRKDKQYEFERKQGWWPSAMRYLYDFTSAIGALLGGSVNFKVGGNK